MRGEEQWAVLYYKRNVTVCSHFNFVFNRCHSVSHCPEWVVRQSLCSVQAVVKYLRGFFLSPGFPPWSTISTGNSSLSISLHSLTCLVSHFRVCTLQFSWTFFSLPEWLLSAPSNSKEQCKQKMLRCVAMLITQGTWLTSTLSVEWFLWAAERLTGNKCYDHPTPPGSLQLHWEHFEAHHSCQQLADFTAQMLS